MSSTISIRLNEDELNLAKKEAKYLHISKSKLIKYAILDYLENLEDTHVYKEYLEERKKGKLKTVTLDEMFAQNGV
jgi:predicted DNA-binding protein